jgi:hypothetical protein
MMDRFKLIIARRIDAAWGESTTERAMAAAT